LLTRFVVDRCDEVIAAVHAIIKESPLVGMVTPGGLPMSVQTNSCGALGWVSDDQGYRYARTDPRHGEPWPAMPPLLQDLAHDAADAAGFAGFNADACLINRYAPGARMTLHQDRQEASLQHPVVSFSFGLPATFLLGGLDRSDPTLRIPLHHGDAIVWGGPSRLRFHGVLPVRTGTHPATGSFRINLTFRCAG
jgi:DNA oxidative demethylase